MLADILPTTARSAEALADPARATLLPEELAIIGSALPARLRAFATARACAHRALAELGVVPAPILRDDAGAPQWPPGVVGSITHCAGYRAAAVARVGDLAAVGIDAEPNMPLPDGVLRRIASPTERAELAELANDEPTVCWDRLLFCAKEATYKAWFPLTRRWLGFDQATVQLRPNRHLAVRLLVDGASPDGRQITGFAGRWHASADLLAVAIAVPAPAR